MIKQVQILWLFQIIFIIFTVKRDVYYKDVEYSLINFLSVLYCRKPAFKTKKTYTKIGGILMKKYLKMEEENYACQDFKN